MVRAAFLETRSCTPESGQPPALSLTVQCVRLPPVLLNRYRSILFFFFASCGNSESWKVEIEPWVGKSTFLHSTLMQQTAYPCVPLAILITTVPLGPSTHNGELTNVHPKFLNFLCADRRVTSGACAPGRRQWPPVRVSGARWPTSAMPGVYPFVAQSQHPAGCTT